MFWAEVPTRKINKNEAKEFYNKLMQKDINTLEKLKSNKPEKHNILDILENVGAAFTGAYMHYKDVSKETIFERNIAERTKLRREKLDKIKEKKQNINNDFFRKYFEQQSPSGMYKKLNETRNTEINQIKVNLIEETLSKLQKIVDYVPKDETYKIEENEKIISIVKRIIELIREINQEKA